MDDSIVLPVVNRLLMVWSLAVSCRFLNGRLIAVHTKCCAMLEKSPAKDDKISTWDSPMKSKSG